MSFLKTAHKSFFCERKREENAGKKETEEIPRKEMPIAAAGQPTTQEPRVCPRLPSTPEPVPKGADLFDEAGAAESAERTEYGGSEGGRGLGGYSYTHSGARGFAQPGSTSSPPQSPAASSSFLLHPLHPHQMAMEPPRTRSRSRSGYYQQYGGGGGNGTGFTGSGVMGSHHHQLHHQQQQLYPQQQQQQHGAGCALLGAHSNHPENQQRSPGSNTSPGIPRLSSVPGAHRIPAAGKRPHLALSLTVYVVGYYPQ